MTTFCHVTRPSTTADGLYAAGLRFGEPRVMAVLGALLGFGYLVAGFANRQLVERVGALLQAPYGCRQATYDLRRLKRKALIEKIPHAHRDRLTSLGRRVAVLFTKAYGRVLAPGQALWIPNSRQTSSKGVISAAAGAASIELSTPLSATCSRPDMKGSD